MYQKSLYDITEVCKMLDTTSRTLRFYEEKGIIQSTTVESHLDDNIPKNKFLVLKMFLFFVHWDYP